MHFSASALAQHLISLEADTVASSSSLLCACNTALTLTSVAQALMREQMRNQDRTMANIESHPEGFNALRRMYENFQEPLMDAAAGQGNSQQDPLAALLGGAAAGGNTSTGKLTCANSQSTPVSCLSDLQVDPEDVHFGGPMVSADLAAAVLHPDL